MLTPEAASAKYLTTFQGHREARPQALGAAQVLRAYAPGRVEIRWNSRTGVSQSVRGILTPPGAGSAKEIADQFLQAHAELFGLTAEHADLRVVATKRRGSLQHVTYQ